MSLRVGVCLVGLLRWVGWFMFCCFRLDGAGCYDGRVLLCEVGLRKAHSAMTIEKSESGKEGMKGG